MTSVPGDPTPTAEDVTAEQIVHHLKTCGYVDPEDGCVPVFPTTRTVGPQVWTAASNLAVALLAQFHITARPALGDSKRSDG